MRIKPGARRVSPVASQTFTPLGTGIIAARADRGSGRAPRYRRRSPPGPYDHRRARASSCWLSCATGRPAAARSVAPMELQRSSPERELQEGRGDDLAELLAPPEKLAHMDAGRTRDLRNSRARLQRRGDQPLLLLTRPRRRRSTDMITSICFFMGLPIVQPMGLASSSLPQQGGLHRGIRSIRASAGFARTHLRRSVRDRLGKRSLALGEPVTSPT